MAQMHRAECCSESPLCTQDAVANFPDLWIPVRDQQARIQADVIESAPAEGQPELNTITGTSTVSTEMLDSCVPLSGDHMTSLLD